MRTTFLRTRCSFRTMLNPGHPGKPRTFAGSQWFQFDSNHRPVPNPWFLSTRGNCLESAGRGFGPSPTRVKCTSHMWQLLRVQGRLPNVGDWLDRPDDGHGGVAPDVGHGRLRSWTSITPAPPRPHAASPASAAVPRAVKWGLGGGLSRTVPEIRASSSDHVRAKLDFQSIPGV